MGVNASQWSSQRSNLFVEFHSHPDGGLLVVDILMVLVVRQHTNRTVLHLRGGEVVAVQESYEQVLGRIKDGSSWVH